MLPVLLTCWKRPEKVLRVIEALKVISPKKVYVSCDGPNKNIVGNKEKVEETKRVLMENINWDCKLSTKFFSENYGCRMAMTKAINWFFNNEIEGIIIEDDCLPSEEFFIFCSELINRYRFNNDIWSISGTNFQNGKWRGEGSYYFSKYFQCWGWATWSDRWQNMDSDLDGWKKDKEKIFNNTFFESRKEKNYWSKIFNNLLYKNKPDSWAYRWAFTCFKNKGLIIIPNKNLVQNIGFDKEATNTIFNSYNQKIKKGLIPLVHPNSILRDEIADNYTFKNHFDNFSLASKIKKTLFNPFYYPKRIINLIIKAIQ